MFGQISGNYNIKKESRHSESVSKQVMTGDIGTQHSGPNGRRRAI